MKTKEEAIKEAWGADWNSVKKSVSKNGYVSQNIEVETECDIFCPIKRPKSLQGIENNNGWIKIESEDDLPKDSWSYWVFRNDNLITTLRDYVDDKNHLEDEINITHYQPIIKPKKPIY